MLGFFVLSRLFTNDSPISLTKINVSISFRLRTGPVWDSKKGILYFIDIKKAEIHA